MLSCSAIPPAKGADREKSSRFEPTFPPFLPETIIWGKTFAGSREKDIFTRAFLTL